VTDRTLSAKKRSKEHADFLLQAYCGLVLRGYNSEREIPDAILRRVWRLGKQLAKEAK
jgi:hypothetical protein